MRLLAILLLTCVLHAQSAIDKKLDGAEPRDGFFRFHWDAKNGKVWLEIDKWNSEFLYLESLPAGIGSNDIGLDRGQLGRSHIVHFERIGPKVLLVANNYDYRTTLDDQAARRAVEESFAKSVLWGFEVAAEDGARVLVDATSFFLRDVHNVAATIRRAENTNFTLDLSRSAFYLPNTRNFPKNTEVEVLLTFTGGPAGRYLSAVTPSSDSVTVREHHSFVELPGPGYTPRAFDPRSGYIFMDYADVTAPLGESMTQRLIARHRLKKKDPTARVSEPVQPIVYYLDRGAPEPARSALLEGARWWNQAFEAAGYKDAFRVELMPEDIDPMDIRYNVIQWVHRSTRGWSYGGAVIDPRTGEIIKGKVTLGSLRVRQDYLIAEALLAPYEKGKPVPDTMREMALARLRQLSAHEVGHTIGLSHNYISSAQKDASVMDYPHPWVELKPDGSIDMSRAYGTGIGEWDKVAIAYGYSDFAPGTNEAAALQAILRAAINRGVYFLSDQDARPPGSAHPSVHLWDNSANAVDELNRWMKVRARALERFSENNIREGQPLAVLAETLAPLYLSHRYQVEAAAKVLGGLEYRYALRGDGQPVMAKVAPQEQRRALNALLATIHPDALAIPERILTILPPRPYGFSRTRESLPARTGLTFDPMSAAETASSLTVSLILNPERATRLIEYAARDSASPSLAEVIDALLNATWKAPPAGTPYGAEVRRTVNHVVLYHLMVLAGNEQAAAQVRAVASSKLNSLKVWLQSASTEAAFYATQQIERFQRDPKIIPIPKPAEPPPGQPIGME
jgi:hypothetical protein